MPRLSDFGSGSDTASSDNSSSVSSSPVHAYMTPLSESDGAPSFLPERLTEYLVNLQKVSSLQDLKESDTPVVACLGVGYVGLQLVKAFAKEYTVIAYDPDFKRLHDISSELAGRNIIATSNPADIAVASHFLIAVPTILHHDKTINTKHLRSAINLVKQHASDGATVVIESSVAVGMTRQLLKSLMTSRQLKGGMSPERVDPGRIKPSFEEIPKIISGLDDITPGSSDSIIQLYKAIFSNIVPVSSPEVAEMTKLYENCQRMICLNYANEMADACASLNIDPFEVSAAAASKPFGYQPYTPGLGVGGHCIPINPYYLLAGADFPLLEAATERMANRPARLGDDIMRRYFNDNRAVASHRPRVLVVGAGFKKGQSVLSNSPGVTLMTHLLSIHGAYVEYIDPLVKQEALLFIPKMEDADWMPSILEQRFDIIVVALNQVGLNMEILRLVNGVMIENFTAALPWGSVADRIHVRIEAKSGL